MAIVCHLLRCYCNVKRFEQVGSPQTAVAVREFVYVYAIFGNFFFLLYKFTYFLHWLRFCRAWAP